ncbi:hypothetical protein Pcinc_025842 [Petrolisthes cinctipes]|uniref:Uncharacterized protein n=1 Tax=Petrolisthes cinctipes TaxID=88211 RepID=A0AAE1F8H6_PETCI|nr:hypothetical protein Pcinc_025842 [Petrolisthes cinctipes]
MFSRHSLFLTLFVSLLVFTSAFIRGYIEERGRKLGRLGRLEAIKASLIRDLLHDKGVMIKDEKKMDGVEELEMVDGEVNEELMGKEVMVGELEEQQTENEAHEEDFVNIKDSYDPYADGENKDGWVKKKEERKTMMGTGTETPPSTIPYMPLRLQIYPPLLNIKQDFR